MQLSGESSRLRRALDTGESVVCANCGKLFLSPEHKKAKYCSRKCFMESGVFQNGRKAPHWRSQNEKHFCELCEAEFQSVKHNVRIFNGFDADVILPDLKIAVLWDGVWHRKQVHAKQDFEYMQKRDSLRLEAIRAAGFEPYIIEDDGAVNKAFVQLEFGKFKVFLDSRNLL